MRCLPQLRQRTESRVQPTKAPQVYVPDGLIFAFGQSSLYDLCLRVLLIQQYSGVYLVAHLSRFPTIGYLHTYCITYLERQPALLLPLDLTVVMELLILKLVCLV